MLSRQLYCFVTRWQCQTFFPAIGAAGFPAAGKAILKPSNNAYRPALMQKSLPRILAADGRKIPLPRKIMVLDDAVHSRNIHVMSKSQVVLRPFQRQVPRVILLGPKLCLCRCVTLCERLFIPAGRTLGIEKRQMHIGLRFSGEYLCGLTDNPAPTRMAEQMDMPPITVGLEYLPC